MKQERNDSYWTFVQKLATPIPSRSENAVFTHVILLKDVQDLAKYYASAAYGSQNETYILKTDGTRMNVGSTQEKTIQSYNVLNALEDMGATISGPIWSRRIPSAAISPATAWSTITASPL